MRRLRCPSGCSGILAAIAAGLLSTEGAAKDLLRVIQSDLQPSIAGSLDQHRSDLEEEGWTVEDVLWPKRTARDTNAHIRLANDVIWPRALATSNLHVFLIGSLPMPYSGYNLWPDGHPDTIGAYAATVYYACPGTNWTDLLDNSSWDSLPSHVNLPGDGKFDQNYAPDPVIACVGFLDLGIVGTPSQWGSSLDTADFRAFCYSNYFQRVHDYRKGKWAPRNIIGAGDYKGGTNGWMLQLALHTVGVSNFVTFSGTSGIESKTPFGIVHDYKAVTHEVSFWSNITRPWAVLDTYYGSYQIDFKSPRLCNPLVRGAIATGSMGPWDYTGIFDGKTLGEIWRQNVDGPGEETLTVLYGDPTVAFPIGGFSDLDMDGMNDRWEVAQFGSVCAPDGSAPLDADNDGLSNQEEFIAGTSPTDARDCLRIFEVSGSPDGRSVVLRWLSRPYRYYTLECAENLPGRSWSNAQDCPRSMPGTGGMMALTNNAVTNAMFFRLKVSTR